MCGADGRRLWAGGADPVREPAGINWEDGGGQQGERPLPWTRNGSG